MNKLSFTGHARYYEYLTEPYQWGGWEQDIEQYGILNCTLDYTEVDWNNQQSIDDFIKSLKEELSEFEKKRGKTFLI